MAMRRNFQQINKLFGNENLQELYVTSLGNCVKKVNTFALFVFSIVR